MGNKFFKYSRLSRSEQKENFKKAISYLLITIGIVVLFLYAGVPILARFALLIRGGGSTSVDIEDTIPPASPRLAPISEYIKNEDISIRGFTEAGVDVELYLNNEKIKEAISDDSGEFTFSEVMIASGSNELYVIARDENKNTSQPSGTLIVNLDKISPVLTVTSPKDGDIFSGAENRTIKISGQSEEGSSVKANGRSASVSDDGSYEVSYSLNDGEQEINIVASDKAGNTTEKNINVTFRL